MENWHFTEIIKVYPARISMKAFGKFYRDAKKDPRPCEILTPPCLFQHGWGPWWNAIWNREWKHFFTELLREKARGHSVSFRIWRILARSVLWIEVDMYWRGLFWMSPSVSYLRSHSLGQLFKGNGHLWEPTVGLRIGSLMRCARRGPHHCVLQTPGSHLHAHQ